MACEQSERSVCDGCLPWDEVDDKYAIMCVQHDYAPTVNVKLAGRKQEAYPRKNWSSMVLYNCGHPAGPVPRKPYSYSHRHMYARRAPRLVWF